MSTLATVADRLRQAADVATVAELLQGASEDLGFPYHALVQHCDIARPPPRFLFLQNYPPNWVETYARLGLHRHDPAQRLASLRPASFAWSDMSSLILLSARERDVLDAGHAAGLGAGFTVPLHAYGLRAASCTFATEPGCELPREALIAAEIVAHTAFAVLFDLLYLPAGRMPTLTPRERECVALVAQGKSDWEIAQILGLKEETVTDYLKAARRRFGVSRRAQLVVAALARGLLGWDEIVTWQPLL